MANGANFPDSSFQRFFVDAITNASIGSESALKRLDCDLGSPHFIFFRHKSIRSVYVSAGGLPLAYPLLFSRRLRLGARSHVEVFNGASLCDSMRNIIIAWAFARGIRRVIGAGGFSEPQFMRSCLHDRIDGTSVVFERRHASVSDSRAQSDELSDRQSHGRLLFPEYRYGRSD